MLNIQKNLANSVYLKIITSVHTLPSKITIRGYSKLSESESRVVKLGRSIIKWLAVLLLLIISEHDVSLWTPIKELRRTVIVFKEGKSTSVTWVQCANLRLLC